MIDIYPDYKTIFKSFKTVDDFLRIDVELVRDFKNRKTGRFEINGKEFYIKKHFECGLGFILDELFHLRRPHIGAGHERAVLDRLHAIGIDTMTVAAFGQDGGTLSGQRSFLVTEALTNIKSMAKVCAEWPATPPAAAYKKRLLETIANTAKRLHESGINHRDFYLCHFLLDMTDQQAGEAGKRPPKLYLMDLHRAQQRNQVPFRWRVKDIGGLYFSAMDIGLTRCDVLRFMRLYTGKPLRQTLTEDRRLWKAVRRRAIRTYRRDFDGDPVKIVL
jgi:heptose I phosphotransferase